MDIEGHCNVMIPKQSIRLLSIERIKLKFEQQKSNELEKRYYNYPQNNNKIKNNKNILIWSIKSIRNYIKRLFLTQLLYEKNIHIALIQELFLTNDDKLYIKDYKV